MSQRVSPAPVVVGVDGSESSLAAVEWAAGEAASRGCDLRVVHAFVWPLMQIPFGAVGAESDGGLRAEARSLLADAVRRAEEVAPEVRVSGHLPVNPPAPALLGESAGAAVVVLGTRGTGGFTALLIGSTAAHLAAHAESPVIVIRPQVEGDGPPESRGQVVVGVDDSPSAAEVIGFAMDEARRLGTGVVAARVVRNHPLRGTNVLLDEQEAPEHARALAEAMAGWQEKYPDVPIRRVLLSGHPAQMLTALALGSRLLVVGFRGAGGFRGLLLGSASHSALRHAPCPVAIVRTQA